MDKFIIVVLATLGIVVITTPIVRLINASDSIQNVVGVLLTVFFSYFYFNIIKDLYNE